MKNYLSYIFLIATVFAPLFVASTLFEWYLLSMCLSSLLFIFINEGKDEIILKLNKIVVLVFWFLYAGAVSFSVAVGGVSQGNRDLVNPFLSVFGISEKIVVPDYHNLPSIISRIDATQQHWNPLINNEWIKIILFSDVTFIISGLFFFLGITILIHTFNEEHKKN